LTRQGCPLVKAMEAVGYFHPWTLLRITLPRPKTGQMVNGSFTNDSFLTIPEDKEPMDNAVDCIHNFNEAASLGSKKPRMGATSEPKKPFQTGLLANNDCRFTLVKTSPCQRPLGK